MTNITFWKLPSVNDARCLISKESIVLNMSIPLEIKAGLGTNPEKSVEIWQSDGFML